MTFKCFHSYKLALLILTALMTLAFLPKNTYAGNEPELLKNYDHWSAYQYTEGRNNKVCFIASSPIRKQGNYNSRGEVYTLITHRPSDNTKDVVSVIAGYTYKSGSTITVNIDGKIFHMITQGDTAWGEDIQTDQRLTKAILRGNTMTIKGTSSRGTLTIDTYSLKGTSGAYRTIGKACNVK